MSNEALRKAVDVLADHIADLHSCVGVLHAYPEMKGTADEISTAAIELEPVRQALRDQDAELATHRANHDALVIRLGEVTARLEAADGLLRQLTHPNAGLFPDLVSRITTHLKAADHV